MISFTKTARAFAAIVLLSTAAAFTQSFPDDTRVIPTAIPDTNLIIDVPLMWEPIPEEFGLGDSLFSMFEGEGSADEELASFWNITEGGSGAMLISRGDGFTRSPLAEITTMARGIQMSRFLTWIVGSGLEIVQVPTILPLGDIEAATFSFLSGQKGEEDVMSMTILRFDEETFLIVDIAPRGADEVGILREMRRSIRLQD